MHSSNGLNISWHYQVFSLERRAMSNDYHPSSFPPPAYQPYQPPQRPYQPQQPYQQPPQRPYQQPPQQPYQQPYWPAPLPSGQPFYGTPPVVPKQGFPVKKTCGCLALGMAVVCALLALGMAFFSFAFHTDQPVVNEPIPTPRPTLPPLHVYNVAGKPTMDAQFINSVLDYYNSPASGKGQVLYDDGVKYGVDPAY